ncbi:unnamed protein product [Rhizoctonia solani]|uniref:RBR-type E3 ubiquitin transferase n=1 Tax=Rhizoctonia solani TaxID=456999 RepID=A0A8H3CKD7_9AGAM|nr:unnamed protein product [Rhizoctonia solani]
MSPRKKNTRKSGPFNQPTISNFFSPKSKNKSTSTRPKRLAQSSLAARPLRSKKSPDLEEVLDLTHSTSPVRQPESPPSAKKRKLKATSLDQSPIRGVQEDSAQMMLSRPSSPDPHISQNDRESGPSTSGKPTPVSPAPSQAGRSQAMLDIDPDEVVESSQTQYLNIRFTPSSQRTFHMDLGNIPAPVFTPVSTRIRQQSHEPSSIQKTPELSNAAEESQSTLFIPSSQGEVSEPYTPKKRNWALLGQSRLDAQAPSGVMSPDAQGSNSVNRLLSTPKRHRPASAMPPPVYPVSADTPITNRAVATNPFTPRFSSPRPILTPMYPSDMIPSSQGEPSLEATELGTVESPPKPSKYPAASLPPFVPSAAPLVQDTPHSRPRATTPLLPISNINLDSPQTPHRPARQTPPSSPTDFPSPGGLMLSLGFETSRATRDAPNSEKAPSIDGKTQTHTLLAPPHLEQITNERALEVAGSQAFGEDSPRRSQSSETVVPSSQPMHDSSPPPEYDLDPKRHSFNQGRLQSLEHIPVQAQPPEGFDSRFPSNSTRPYFTARTHQSSPTSSQSLPQSQSPIKGGRFDPNQSAAGVQGVFGMLGFGSEADNQEGQTVERPGGDEEEVDLHIPVTYDLPPSSPPPQTPTPHDSRESSPDSYLIPVGGQKSKAKHRAGKPSVRDSPLIRAFEAAKKRSKTGTPSVRRSAANVSQTASSPTRPLYSDNMEVDSSPVRDPRPSGKRPTPKTGPRAALGVAHSPSLAGRSRRATQPKRSQRQKSVDCEIVESSDAEEMEIDVPLSPTFRTSTRTTTGAKNNAEPTKLFTPGRKRPWTQMSEEAEDRDRPPATPVREERLPSSVSPSPIQIHYSPPARTHHSSPPSENTQTQEEAETPWESIRPSQSVSQVYERQLIEEAERRSRMERDAEHPKPKVKVLVEETPDMPNEQDGAESQQQEESPDEQPVRQVTISLNPRSPTNVPNEPPRLALPPSFSTPRTRRTAEKPHYIVTPSKVIRPTPARTTPSRKSMTPSSMAGEDDPDEEYTPCHRFATFSLRPLVAHPSPSPSRACEPASHHHRYSLYAMAALVSESWGAGRELDPFGGELDYYSRIRLNRRPRLTNPARVPPLADTWLTADQNNVATGGANTNNPSLANTNNAGSTRNRNNASQNNALQQNPAAQSQPQARNRNRNRNRNGNGNGSRGVQPSSSSESPNGQPGPSRGRGQNNRGQRGNQSNPEASNLTIDPATGETISKRAAKRRRAKARKAAARESTQGQGTRQQQPRNGSQNTSSRPGVPVNLPAVQPLRIGRNPILPSPQPERTIPTARPIVTQGATTNNGAPQSTSRLSVNETGGTTPRDDTVRRWRNFLDQDALQTVRPTNRAASPHIPPPTRPSAPVLQAPVAPLVPRASQDRPGFRLRERRIVAAGAPPIIPPVPPTAFGSLWDDSDDEDDPPINRAPPTRTVREPVVRIGTPTIPNPVPRPAGYRARTAPVRARPTTACLICLDVPDAFPQNRPTTRCAHSVTVCAPCLEQHISHAVLSQGLTTIACPDSSCRQNMEYADVIRGTKNARACQDRYEALLLRRTLEAEPNFVWCKSANCNWGQVHESGANAPIVICQVCRARSCFTHNVPWHTGLTCAQYSAQHAHKERDNAASEAYISQHAKQCPNPSCGRRIEKSEGCDHMTCRLPAGCGHEFCWVCLADYRPIRRDGNHHHNSTCRYYAPVQAFQPGLTAPTLEELMRRQGQPHFHPIPPVRRVEPMIPPRPRPALLRPQPQPHPQPQPQPQPPRAEEAPTTGSLLGWIIGAVAAAFIATR